MNMHKNAKLTPLGRRCGLFHNSIGLANFNYTVINNRLVSRGWVIMQS